MDDNTSIQFRLRLAQINGINMNEAKDHVSTEIDYVGNASNRAEDAKTHGVKITPSRNAVQGSDHSVSGPRESVRKFLVHHYGDKDEAKENHPEVFKGMNEEKIDEDFEVGRKVNVTNPKATPRYEITDKDDTHYHLKNPDGKTMKLPKERIHRVNKSK